MTSTRLSLSCQIMMAWYIAAPTYRLMSLQNISQVR